MLEMENGDVTVLVACFTLFFLFGGFARTANDLILLSVMGGEGQQAENVADLFTVTNQGVGEDFEVVSVERHLDQRQELLMGGLTTSRCLCAV